MIPARRTGRLSRLTLTVLLAGSAALLAPAAVPAAPAVAEPSAVPAPAGHPDVAASSAMQADGALNTGIPVVSEVPADSLTASLTALAASQPSPGAKAVRQAFGAAGFPEDSVEVSLDITPTGLAVDSIRGATVSEGECLFGEVRDGKVAVTVLPVLDSGFCFVGDQR
ncbi:hypothetical protein QNO00_02920 [Arthrobacter sp. zg-Y1219]|uniref:DUF6993 domain-containing protein n=1 Tax=Arthrobacter sp. zg-Y1219 TaxID=3049067 RepID=UPI0024C2933F|nr:hypothetical protein [Arthrobacter sp. zg-Y1219]MDK1359223.1 hypothetical protein [Arthrobacter sp. zg-Y1219]